MVIGGLNLRLAHIFTDLWNYQCFNDESKLVAMAQWAVKGSFRITGKALCNLMNKRHTVYLSYRGSTSKLFNNNNY